SGGSRLRELEETTKRRFFLVGKEGEHLDHFKVLDQGTLEKLAPKVPVDVGQDVEVKLGEVGLHDPHAGVGKIDDVDIVVGDAAKLVGKKVTVRVTALTDGLAWAELLAPAEDVDEPLTAEGEAERPTRAKRSTAPKKQAESEPAEELEAEVDADADADAEAGEDATEEDGDEPAAPAKKKTRRGSRGGRNRKKKTATAAGSAVAARAEAAPETEEAPEAPEEPELEEQPAAPVIHVPDRELTDEDGDAPTPAKKRTRRGSRGGRNRRKKTATAPVATVEATETEAPETAEEPSENGDWGYTPMSQWGMDDDAA
ncbi:MAG TPA: TRAM domain-containing protein, partial [Gaiellaceae bacterium]|nr:TRAM domain-containing protein [Gaiellaceae bacterium]